MEPEKIIEGGGNLTPDKKKFYYLIIAYTLV
jgi:hypothetical protein